jgi:small-conductance mechanosensitive channel
MPYLLEDLTVDRVDLVDEGANSAAFIALYKRKEQSYTMDVKDIIAKMTTEHASVIQAEFDRLNGEVVKATETTDTITAEHATATKSLEKATGDLKTTNDELVSTKSELETLKASDGTLDEDDALMKSMPEAAREFVLKMKTQKEAAEQAVIKAKEAEKEADAIAKAATLKALPVEQSKLVEVLKGASPDLLEVLTAVSNAMNDSVLGEIGKNHTGATNLTQNESWAKIEAKGKEIAKERSISKAKAITAAVEENPDLYKAYLEGGAN